MNKEVEILVIGAGPAGLSAAIEAAKCGAEVLVVDEKRIKINKNRRKLYG